MSMNSYMHPRNIYKQGYDFEELIVNFEDFRKVTSLNLDGKIRINFQDKKAVETLTRCLLKKDFNLEIDMPENRLVPTVPLRLNYILWLEDAIEQLKLNDNVVGIDIGCGASCIFPLLAARRNNWTMLGIEKDELSFKSACDNVKKNNLQNLVEINRGNNSNDKLFGSYFDDTTKRATFCMCNPPFFSSLEQTKYATCVNRTGKRKAPRNASTGQVDDMVTEGGEIEFVTKIIVESLRLQDRISFYSTMLGCKKSLQQIFSVFKLHSITNYLYTELCQGYTTRWVVAWTFSSKYLLRTVTVYGPTVQSQFSTQSIEISNDSTTLKDVSQTMLDILQKELLFEVTTSDETCTKSYCCIIKTNVCLWTGQRKKRRKQLQQDDDVHNIQNTTNINHNPLIVALVKLNEEATCYKIDIMYIDGSSGKDGIYQLMLCLRNRINELLTDKKRKKCDSTENH